MILNLTQHDATPDQIAAGVIDLHRDVRDQVRALLTFDEPPTAAEIRARAYNIAELASMHASPEDRAGDDGLLPEGDPGGFANQAMIGGAAYLMPALEDELLVRGIEPLHAFTRRDVSEVHDERGQVEKRVIFRFAGWVRTFGA